MLAQEVYHLPSPAARHLLAARPYGHVVPGERRPPFADRLEMARQMHRTRELIQDDGSGRSHEGIAADIVHRPDLHVAAVGGVAQIRRIEQHDAGDVGIRQRVPDSVQSIGPDPALVEVGLYEGFAQSCPAGAEMSYAANQARSATRFPQSM